MLNSAFSLQNLIGLVVARVEGGWQASVEVARGSYRDGPVCADPDAAVRAALGPSPAVALPPPPVSILPPPSY